MPYQSVLASFRIFAMKNHLVRYCNFIFSVLFFKIFKVNGKKFADNIIMSLVIYSHKQLTR